MHRPKISRAVFVAPQPVGMIISEGGIANAPGLPSTAEEGGRGRYDPGKVSRYSISPCMYVRHRVQGLKRLSGVSWLACLVLNEESLDETLAKPRLGPEGSASVRRPRKLTPPTILSSLLFTGAGIRNQQIGEPRT